MDLTFYLNRYAFSPLNQWRELEPWHLTNQSAQYVLNLFDSLSLDEFTLENDIAVHHSATIETGAILKGPAIIGSRCFIAAGAYLRGGNWLEEGCVIGPGAELKSSFLFKDCKLTHLNFVGDSIVGQGVNFEAGSLIANYRNERDNKEIRVVNGKDVIYTGVEKFGAVVGHYSRVGANAVIAPGSILLSRTIVGRLALLDI